jgi:nicotinamidase/pyrazinamidase
MPPMPGHGAVRGRCTPEQGLAVRPRWWAFDGSGGIANSFNSLQSEPIDDPVPGNEAGRRNDSMSFQITASDVLLIIDVQNDFCPGGRLPVAHGDEIVMAANAIARRFQHVVLTQDWHPPGHLSFASTHPGKQPFEEIEVGYGSQMLWPEHCVQGTQGAAFRADLDIPHAELILRKGFRPTIDSYSAFFENDHVTPTGLAGYLRERDFGRVFLTGLAFDFCVRYSAEDAAGHDFRAIVIEDGCRAIDLSGSVSKTRASFSERDISCITSDELG